MARDLNTLLGIIFVSTVVVILVNLVIDLIYARLDPRIAADEALPALPRQVAAAPSASR